MCSPPGIPPEYILTWYPTKSREGCGSWVSGLSAAKVLSTNIFCYGRYLNSTWLIIVWSNCNRRIKPGDRWSWITLGITTPVCLRETGAQPTWGDGEYRRYFFFVPVQLGDGGRWIILAIATAVCLRETGAQPTWGGGELNDQSTLLWSVMIPHTRWDRGYQSGAIGSWFNGTINHNPILIHTFTVVCMLSVHTFPVHILFYGS